jgi:hypothetical protein
MANLPVKGIPQAFEKANPAEVWPPGCLAKTVQFKLFNHEPDGGGKPE